MCSRERYLYEIVRLRSPHFSCRLCAVISGLVAGPDPRPQRGGGPECQADDYRRSNQAEPRDDHQRSGRLCVQRGDTGHLYSDRRSARFQAFGAPGRFGLDASCRHGRSAARVRRGRRASRRHCRSAPTTDSRRINRATDRLPEDHGPAGSRAKPILHRQIGADRRVCRQPEVCPHAGPKRQFAGFDRGRSAAD